MGDRTYGGLFSMLTSLGGKQGPLLWMTSTQTVATIAEISIEQSGKQV